MKRFGLRLPDMAHQALTMLSHQVLITLAAQAMRPAKGRPRFTPPALQAREKLDFALDQSIPRYWLDNDPIKTRIVDAVMYTFPEGERYFISSVRLFRDQISDDAALLAAVREFSRQEGQHGLVHLQFNQLLQDQGLPVQQMVARQRELMNQCLERWTPAFNLAYTAGCEHLTAMMAVCFFGRQQVLAQADPRVRAMLAWHAIEEMEHKAVAYDVMQKVKVPYLTRARAMLVVSALFFGYSLYAADCMLRHDGQTRRQRLQLLTKGLPWLLGRQGILAPLKQQWLDYFRPDFHPWQHPAISHYAIWRDTYEQTGDALKAGDALWQAAA